MRIDPARVHLGLPEGLLHILRDALDKLGLGCRIQRGQRPRADEGLVEEVFLMGIGHLRAGEVAFLPMVPPLPALQRMRPCPGDLGEDIDPGAHVLAALRVVRRGRQKAVRPTRQALGVAW